MSFYHDDPKIGQRIRLVGGQKGVIKASVENLGFPMYEIQLDSGKCVTEARYRFDIIPEPIGEAPVETTSPNLSEVGLLYDALFNNLPDSPELNATTMGVDSDSEPELAEQAEHENTNKSKVKQRQFITVDEESLDNFITEQENKSTAKKNTV